MLARLRPSLSEGASRYGDKGYNDVIAEAFLALDGLRLIPIRKKNMQAHERADELICDSFVDRIVAHSGIGKSAITV